MTMTMTRKLALCLAWFAALAGGCVRAPLKDSKDAMRRVSAPRLRDDLPVGTLTDAVASEIAYLEKLKPPLGFRFGPTVLTQAEYVAGLKHFLDLAKAASSPEQFFDAVQRDFDFYEVYGQERWGDVFMTSYYEPLLQGSEKRTERFSQPLYGVPGDLVSLNLTLFDDKFSDERKLRGRMQGRALVPYYTREEIDAKGALHGRHLEICWVDPIDAFFLQIQGSGTIELQGGKRIRVGYAEKNGQRYQAIGKFLADAIPADQLSMQTIQAHLRSLDRAALQALLNKNPSYVFFRKLDEQSAVTSLGVPATDGRTIATDPKFFPKGALAFLDSPGDPAPGNSSEPIHRFVLDQDMGGAIQGGGRVDLFWGRGPEAEAHAGSFKQRGRLYYLVPKTR